MKLFIGMVIAFLSGMLIMDYIITKDISKKKPDKEIQKWLSYYQILNMWLDLKQQGKSVKRYLEQNGYKRIAIYGMRELGERLYVELVDAGAEVVCVIDQNKNVLGDFELISPEDDIPQVDLIIVTVEYCFNEIKEKMSQKVTCPILSLSGFLGNAFHRNL